MSMRDFVILSKIGKNFILILFFSLGDGAYSEVYKVKRLSDGLIYALKKVIIFLIFYSFIGQNG